ncbi:unnamed protein product [Polarella glacialis]|uniref:Uncharacterized protein n=1 Tax=Polarella glacialis TaxID=89957 RepID=A0A813I5H8_POLGL|nr:unnamed protein product [Polarella glacialis]
MDAAVAAALAEVSGGLAAQLRAIVEAELAQRTAELERRERAVAAREEALERRERAEQGSEQSGQGPAEETPKASVFQEDEDSQQPQPQKKSLQKPEASEEKPQVTVPRAATEGEAGSAKDLKGFFEKKATRRTSETLQGEDSKDQDSKAPPPLQKKAPLFQQQPPQESEEKLATNASLSSDLAGGAKDLKGIFEQKAEQARRDSTSPQRKAAWKPVKNELPLPGDSGKAPFRAHEAPFKRGVKTVGMGSTPDRRSLQELLKSDELRL